MEDRIGEWTLPAVGSEAAARKSIQLEVSPLFDAPQASRTRAKRGDSETPFVPTPSGGHGAQVESKAPPLGGGSGATRSLLLQASMASTHLLTRPSTVAY